LEWHDYHDEASVPHDYSPGSDYDNHEASVPNDYSSGPDHDYSPNDDHYSPNDDHD
jgi:hypothetical protein